RDFHVTGVQTCALPISSPHWSTSSPWWRSWLPLVHCSCCTGSPSADEEGQDAPHGGRGAAGGPGNGRGYSSGQDALRGRARRERSEERRVGNECGSRGR